MSSTQTEKPLHKDLNRIEQRYRMSIRSGVSVCVARDIRAKEMKRHPEVSFNIITGIRSNHVIKKYTTHYKNINHFYEKADFYACLKKYEDLNPLNFHFATIPQKLMDIIFSKYHPTIDCFASPYDNVLPIFCSMYPLTDSSIGNFFDMDITTFEGEVLWIHPPNIEVILDKMINYVDYILKSVKCSCIIVVPDWPDIVKRLQDNEKYIEDIALCDEYVVSKQIFAVRPLHILRLTNQ